MADTNNQRYNHKYMHCTGDKCEFRDDCIHFLAWQEALALNLKNIDIQERCTDLGQSYVRVRIEPPQKK